MQDAKKGKYNALLISLDIVGFALIFVGASLIRFSKDEIISITGGFVLAGGAAVLSISRLIPK